MNYCTSKNYNKNFVEGAGAAVNKSGSANCQLFMAQTCAKNAETSNCLTWNFDSYLPGHDILNRPISQSQNEAFLRNVAIQRYLFQTLGCQKIGQQLDPQNSKSPIVYSWNNTNAPYLDCNQNYLTLNNAQINAVIYDQDPVILKLVQERPKYDDILYNIKATLVEQKLWDALVGTSFYNNYN